MKSLVSRVRDLIKKLIVYFNKEVPNCLLCQSEGDIKPSAYDNLIFCEAQYERDMFLNFYQAHTSQEEVE